MVMTYVTTPAGEELVLLSRSEFEAMKEAAEHTKAVSDWRSGRLPGLSPEEALAFAEAPSPLTFWRKRAGLRQAELAKRAGIAQNYLSDIEKGKREGGVGIWLKLAAALGVPIEALVDEE